MGQPRVILLELNELSPTLVDRFIGEKRLPAFQQFRAESHVYVSESAERAPYLDPWIQWITVHTGLDYADHQIFHLGDGTKLSRPSLWDLLSDEGRTVWVCGSMNVNYRKPLRGAVLPDPWAIDLVPQPRELGPYYSFTRRQVMEHTNPDAKLRPQDYLAFAQFMASHGLSIRSAVAIARQLAAEKLSKSDVRWKRAVLLDALQMDVFRAVYRKLRPQFATFFSNSTAHFQHMYWRNFEPQLFKVKPGAAEQAAYAGAIRFGYENHDKLVRDTMELAGEDTTVILCTALSQQPCLKYEDVGGKRLYRPRDFVALLKACGVQQSFTTAPVMAEQFQILFESEQDATAAAEQIETVKMGGRRLLAAERNGKDLFCWCINYSDGMDKNGTVEGRGVGFKFSDHLYEMEGLKSGMHHPDGIFWVRLPEREHRVFGEKLPLNRIAPTVLSMYGLRKPEHMPGAPLPGYAPQATKTPGRRAA